MNSIFGQTHLCTQVDDFIFKILLRETGPVRDYYYYVLMMIGGVYTLQTNKIQSQKSSFSTFLALSRSLPRSLSLRLPFNTPNTPINIW